MILDRIWPAVAAGAVLTVLVSSNVPLNLWLLSGPAATALAVAYGAAMAAIAVKPDEINFHKAAFALAALFWGGRAAGFAEIVISQQRTDLAGAVAERVAILFGLGSLHLMAARRVGQEEALIAEGLIVRRKGR